ncbi:MAG: PKD domain-containing protein [Marinifilaceae bacterium]|jgi:PKD repeat protein|nr:PKD domain-containing protein [Marinifilaceae bacterium]
MNKITYLICILTIFYGLNHKNIMAQDTIRSIRKINSDTNIIVISEKTYKSLTSKNLNKRKLAKIKDKESNNQIPRFPDAPLARLNYENSILINPITKKIPSGIREKELEFYKNNYSQFHRKFKNMSNVYTPIGPNNVGGRTRALAVDVSDRKGSTYLAGGVSGGLWRTTDGGFNWTRVSGFKNHPAITCIVQDTRPGHTNVWYYGTGELIGNSASETGAAYKGVGIFKSIDGGLSFHHISNLTMDPDILKAFDYVWNIAVNPINGDLYAACFNMILSSSDGGTSWIKEHGNISSYNYYSDVICTPQGDVYSCLFGGGDSYSGIKRKGLGETNWENLVSSNIYAYRIKRMVMDYAKSVNNKDVVFFLAYEPGNSTQDNLLLRLDYTDASNYSFTDLSANIPIRGGGSRDVNGFNAQTGYNLVVAVSPENENIVFIGGTNLFRSDDGFSSKDNIYWIGGYATENNVTMYDNHHPDIHNICFIHDFSDRMLCGHDGGISYTADYKQDYDSNPYDNKFEPVDWFSLNNGYLTTQAYTLAINSDDLDDKSLMTGFQDNGTWISYNNTEMSDWENVLSGDGAFCALIQNGDYSLSSTQYGRVYLQTHPDVRPYYFTRVDPSFSSTYNRSFIHPFEVDAMDDTILYYPSDDDIYVNSNIFDIPKFSNSTTNINWIRIPVTSHNHVITVLKSSYTTNHTLYYGNSVGELYKITNANTKDASEENITGGNFPSGAYPISIDLNPLNEDEILIAFSNYGVESIFHTLDGGANWSAVGGNLESTTDAEPSVRSIAIVNTPESIVYLAGTSIGLFQTEKLNGNSTKWTHTAENVIGNSIVSMIKSRRDGFIAVSTHGNGSFSSDMDFSGYKPKVFFIADKTNVDVGAKIDFKNLSVGDNISSIKWTFEGASPSSSSDINPMGISYNNPGYYSVELEIRNSRGVSTFKLNNYIKVSGVKADFSSNLVELNVDTDVQFIDKSFGEIDSWLWSFDGGVPSSSTAQNPIVRYEEEGVYDVSLSVSSNFGTSTEIKEQYIKVEDLYSTSDKWLQNISDDAVIAYFDNYNKEPISGSNKQGFSQFAEKFTLPNTKINSVKKVSFYVIHAQSTLGSDIKIKIWDGGEKPGKVLYEQNIAITKFNEGTYNDFDLNYPVRVSGDFYVGYEITNNLETDKFAVSLNNFSNSNSWNNTAYIGSRDFWYSYTDLFASKPSTSLGIKAFIGLSASPTSITKLDNKDFDNNSLIVYPNPMKDKVNVKFPNTNNSKFKLIVVDNKGKIVEVIKNITGDNVLINRGRLKPGMHLLKLIGDKKYIGKLIVK